MALYSNLPPAPCPQQTSTTGQGGAVSGKNKCALSGHCGQLSPCNNCSEQPGRSIWRKTPLLITGLLIKSTPKERLKSALSSPLALLSCRSRMGERAKAAKIWRSTFSSSKMAACSLSIIRSSLYPYAIFQIQLFRLEQEWRVFSAAAHIRAILFCWLRGSLGRHGWPGWDQCAFRKV